MFENFEIKCLKCGGTNIVAYDGVEEDIDYDYDENSFIIYHFNGVSLFCCDCGNDSSDCGSDEE